MTLTVGTRLGSYEIVALLGAGGMGEVYRARDTKLDREVAIKVLPELFVADPERVARFQREAKTLAALNHPHIGGIYGLEDAEGVRALVLELVDGPTLADRIAQGPIPLDEALPIAKQMAEALEAAHEQGIIHRDLKPANIKLRPDGTVKVLDFGLAKALDAGAGGAGGAGGADGLTASPTITTPAMTAMGVILGTAAYMSPEQAKGRPADKRSDVWALGCVLYEMLTGRRAFEGDDVSDTLAFVLTKEPDWNSIPANTPAVIRTLLVRCLQKDRKRRLPDLGVARLEIDETLAASPVVRAEPTQPPPVGRWQRAAPWSIAALSAVGLFATLVLWAPWKSGATSSLMRLNVALDVDASLVVDQGPALAMSPDGTTLAFVAEKADGDDSLYVRRLDQLQASLLPGTSGARNPFFSPNGQWIAFFANGKLKKVAATGGSVVTLCDAPNGRGGSWASDDLIAFLPVSTARPGVGGGIMRVSSASGEPTPLTRIGPDELTERWPQVLPGGKAVLYTVTSVDRLAINSGAYENADIVVQPLPADGTRKIVQRGAYYGRYLPSGHLAYLQKGTLFVAPFDLGRLELTGPPVPAIGGVMSSTSQGSAQLAVSDGGTLIYVSGQQDTGALPISWIDRSGKVSALRATASFWSNLQFSPDGRRVALNIRAGDGGRNDIWIYEWDREALARLTDETTSPSMPVWTPDGRRIVFASASFGGTRNLFWQRADGTGAAERLTLAYSSDKSGQFEIYVRPFQQQGGEWLVSIGGGRTPIWSRARHELLYVQPNGQMTVVAYHVEVDAFRADKPRSWSEARLSRTTNGRDFDIHPDGERIAARLVPAQQVTEKRDRFILVSNFFDEVRRIAPAEK